MAKIEERLLSSVGKKTADELARVARDTLKRLDPSGVQRRAKAARDQADVEFYPDRDNEGMGDAATAKAGGDPRPIGSSFAEASGCA